MTAVNRLTVITRTSRMAWMIGMQVWMTGKTKITGMTKTQRFLGMTGVTGMIRMTTVNGLTVMKG